MPVYEFLCAACGAEFDRLLGYSDPRPPCPRCEGVEVNRRISLIAGLGGNGAGREAPAGSGCACGGACACGR